MNAPVGDDAFINDHDAVDSADDDDDDDKPTKGSGQKQGRRKIKIEFIADKSRRHITFSKRKAGIMKKAYELSTLTGTQVLLLVVSETGLVYTFTTAKLQPLVTQPEGKNLIQACLNAPHGTLPTQSMPAAPPGSRPPGAGPAAPQANIAGGLSIGGSASSSSSPPPKDDDGDDEEDTNPQGGRAKTGDKRRRTTSNNGPNTRSGNGPPTSPTGGASSTINLGPPPGATSQTQAPPSPTSQNQQPHTSPPHQHAQPQQYPPANGPGGAYGTHEMYSGHAHMVPQNTYHQYGNTSGSAPPQGQPGQPMGAHSNHWQAQQASYRSGR